MFSFFKRSKNRAQASSQSSSSAPAVSSPQSRSHAEQQACASDLWHRKIDDGNRENLIQLAATQQQYENESIGDRAPTSNSTKNGFFIDIMAKGKNRRNYGKNKQQSAYQNHQQQHNNKLKNDNTKLATSSTSVTSNRNNNNGKQENFTACDGVERKRNDDKITSEKCENIEKIQQQQHASPNNQSKNNQKYVKSKNITSNNNNEDHEKTYCGVANGNDDKFNNGDDGNRDGSARHQNDRNNTEETEQKQYGVADQPADGSETAANFVKGIIFEKYKRPLSPLQIRPIEVDVDNNRNGENVLAPEIAGESIHLIMGQQPAKHYHNSNHHYQQSSGNHREYYRKISTPPISPPGSPVSSPLHTPLSSPPETPSIGEQLSSQDDKDIFYEASDSSGSILVPESINQFDFPTTTTAQVNGNEKNNCANNPKDTDTFPIVTADNDVPIVVSFSDSTGSNSTANCLVINNNNNNNSAAATSETEYITNKLKIINNKDHGDSPDSGVEIDNDNSCCDTFHENHDNVTIDGDDFKYAFNENSVNNKNNLKNCDDNNILVRKTNSTSNLNLSKNTKNGDDVDSDNYQKSQQQLQKSQSKKKMLLEDAVSLPDIIESTATVVVSNMVGGGTPEETNQNGHGNDSLHTNGYEK